MVVMLLGKVTDVMFFLKESSFTYGCHRIFSFLIDNLLCYDNVTTIRMSSITGYFR